MLETVEHLRVSYLGKKGHITALLKAVVNLPVEERPEMGKLINQVKQELQALLAQQDTWLSEQNLQQQLHAETIDISLAW